MLRRTDNADRSENLNTAGVKISTVSERGYRHLAGKIVTGPNPGRFLSFTIENNQYAATNATPV
jgi:hypothetical protein